MKKMIFISTIFSLLFVFCNKEEPIINHDERKQLKSTSGDTLTVKFDEIIQLQDGVSWIKFVDVEDSRCPLNVNCVWEGNARVKFIYFDGGNENLFYLNTHGSQSMVKEAVIGDLYFNLTSVTPYPDGTDISKADYQVAIYLQYLDKLEGMKSEVSGIVRDYTGLDGCGWVIELDDGKKLEPAVVLPNIKFYDGQEVILWYKELEDMASICMAGDMVKIYKMVSVSCPSYTDITMPLDEYPSDWIGMDTAYIQDSTLFIAIGHSGGCAEHSYKLLKQPLLCATPPVPDPVLWLSHNANGDLCEAFLRDTLCFNIAELYNQFYNFSTVEIRTISGNRSITLDIK